MPLVPEIIGKRPLQVKAGVVGPNREFHSESPTVEPVSNMTVSKGKAKLICDGKYTWKMNLLRPIDRQCNHELMQVSTFMPPAFGGQSKQPEEETC
jgi:hypothetical protein